jgi:hypothetical protein
MNKLTVTLQQHTPIIHFQHEQAGAVLRATEIKPKLDRFIINELKRHNLSFQDLLQEDRKNNALDYKLKISASPLERFLLTSYLSKQKRDELDRRNTKYISPAPCFGDEDKYGLMYQLINLTFFSFNQMVLEAIENNISAFFITTNFGFRQSKGFGSFSVSKIGEKSAQKPIQLDEIAVIKLLKQYGEGVYIKRINNSLSDIFHTINEDYQLLKSGKNFRGYQKSKLCEYMIFNSSLRWEKRKIKLELKNKHPHIFKTLKYDVKKSNANRIDGRSQINEQFVFARSLLGLSEHIEFATNSPQNKVKIKIFDVAQNNDECIQRFQSPIMFKVLNDNIFILANKINPLMFGREFKFTLTNNRNNGNDLDLCVLKTPSPQQFNLMSFLDDKLVTMGWKKL